MHTGQCFWFLAACRPSCCVRILHQRLPDSLLNAGHQAGLFHDGQSQSPPQRQPRRLHRRRRTAANVCSRDVKTTVMLGSTNLNCSFGVVGEELAFAFVFDEGCRYRCRCCCLFQQNKIFTSPSSKQARRTHTKAVVPYAATKNRTLTGRGSATNKRQRVYSNVAAIGKSNNKDAVSRQGPSTARHRTHLCPKRLLPCRTPGTGWGRTGGRRRT